MLPRNAGEEQEQGLASGDGKITEEESSDQSHSMKRNCTYVSSYLPKEYYNHTRKCAQGSTDKWLLGKDQGVT